MQLSDVLKQIQPIDPNEPFIFISYSSLDAERVWRDVLRFQQMGYNVWLDEKNLDKTRASWREDALEAIQDVDCKLLVYYVSRNSLVSEPCFSELSCTIAAETLAVNGGPLKFIAVDVEPIDDIIKFSEDVRAEFINNREIPKPERKKRAITLSNCISQFFKSNNEKVRVKACSLPNRKMDYYEEITASFPDITRVLPIATPAEEEPAAVSSVSIEKEPDIFVDPIPEEELPVVSPEPVIEETTIPEEQPDEPLSLDIEDAAPAEQPEDDFQYDDGCFDEYDEEDHPVEQIEEKSSASSRDDTWTTLDAARPILREWAWKAMLEANEWCTGGAAFLYAYELSVSDRLEAIQACHADGVQPTDVLGWMPLKRKYDYPGCNEWSNEQGFLLTATRLYSTMSDVSVDLLNVDNFLEDNGGVLIIYYPDLSSVRFDCGGEVRNIYALLEKYKEFDYEAVKKRVCKMANKQTPKEQRTMYEFTSNALENVVKSFGNNTGYHFKERTKLKYKQLKSAVESYAHDVSVLIIIGMLDTTFFSTGKEGFTLTATRLYSSLPENPVIDLFKISEVSLHYGENYDLWITTTDGEYIKFKSTIYTEEIKKLLDSFVNAPYDQLQANSDQEKLRLLKK